ncbi:ABC transporter permease subunit [filamentous cyanobacterium LEGE 11480]|uniref:ABC transporter permease subunit n=1 Tax=Romeriopsis navalis LEGE 11480 TaxID=2777977 RepID=A0A928Z1X9_9CYAN|nr:ABC transporter permease [Romeriopsis navalis]MBE9028954.1 ABC transporter permease subunit [Romeriopsis navalis LEGE 11480]
MFRTIRRVKVIASNVFREVFRERALYLLGFYAIALGLAARLLPEVSAGLADRKILPDVGLAGIHILGLVLAIFVGTGLINKEIEKRTVLVLMAKPVSRSEFIVGKHIGLSAVLAVLVAAMTAIYLIVMEMTKISYDMQPTMITIGFMWLLLSLMTAVAIGFGGMMSSLLATLMTVAVYFMGTLSGDLVNLGKLTENLVIEQMTQAFYLILPDFSRLDLKNQAVYSLLPSNEILLQNAGYGVLYIVLVLTISSILFSAREF